MTGRIIAALAASLTTGVFLTSGIVPAEARHAGGGERAVHARALHPGEIVQLDVTCSCQAQTVTATVFGRVVPLAHPPDSGIWRALIGIDVETAPGTYSIRVAVSRATGEPLKATRALAVVAKQFPTRRLTVDARFV